MVVMITVSELIARKVWDQYCKMAGVSGWELKDGFKTGDDEVELTEDQAKKLGILK